jgi:hypothetical protein
MPSTVDEVFEAAGVRPAGVVPWLEPPAPPAADSATGVYVVALPAPLPTAPIAADAVQALLDVRPECRLDGKVPTVESIVDRLAQFWFPDEVVLYIGCAPKRARRPSRGEVSNRVGEYYKTRLGARSPHAGGWFLKTLSNLAEVRVNYGYCADVLEAEGEMLGCFAGAVSTTSRAALHDRERVMPFANLEFPKGLGKNHGIDGAKAPRRRG